MSILYTKRKLKSTLRKNHTKVGNRGRTREVLGGGGPANAGAIPSNVANRRQPNFRTPNAVLQPSWAGEFDQTFVGHARPANTPITAGLKKDNFRELGDGHGARQ